MLTNYPAHLSLDVSTDNTKAVAFYKRVGLEIVNTYVTEELEVEFVTFKTPEGFTYAGTNGSATHNSVTSLTMQ